MRRNVSGAGASLRRRAHAVKEAPAHGVELQHGAGDVPLHDSALDAALAEAAQRAARPSSTLSAKTTSSLSVACTSPRFTHAPLSAIQSRQRRHGRGLDQQAFRKCCPRLHESRHGAVALAIEDALGTIDDAHAARLPTVQPLQRARPLAHGEDDGVRRRLRPSLIVAGDHRNRVTRAAATRRRRGARMARSSATRPGENTGSRVMPRNRLMRRTRHGRTPRPRRCLPVGRRRRSLARARHTCGSRWPADGRGTGATPRIAARGRSGSRGR